MTEKLGTTLTKISRFSNGRRLLVLNALLGVATELGIVDLATAIEEARDNERATRKLERMWRLVRKKQSKGRGKAREIDIQLDRIISAMFGALSSRLAALDPSSELAGKIRALIDTYYPEGVAGITEAEYDDALAIIEEMNEDFATYSEEQLKELSIEYHVAELARLAPLFQVELNKTGGGFRFKTLYEARLEGHERLCELIGGILFFTRDRNNAAHVANRAALLAPILAADERVKARRKRKNGPDVEVDPNTGEELLDDDELVDEEGIDQDLDDAAENV